MAGEIEEPWRPPTVEEKERRDREYMIEAAARSLENALDLVKHAAERGDADGLLDRLAVAVKCGEHTAYLLLTAKGEVSDG